MTPRHTAHGGEPLNATAILLKHGAVLLTTLAALGCAEAPFQAFEKNDRAFFTLYAALDLYADTQHVRVMPVRQNLFGSPDPIDAVVTLRNVQSGRTVVLRDSLAAFVDSRSGATSYVHNFWTAERLEPRATYRVTATRSDGAQSSAVATLPGEVEVAFANLVRANDENLDFQGTVAVRADNPLYVQVLSWLRDTCAAEADAMLPFPFPTSQQNGNRTLGLWPVEATDASVSMCARGADRHEIRVVTGTTDWPYHAELADVEIARPGTATSNVEDGLGFVGGVAIRTFPFHRCVVLVTRPGRVACSLFYDSGSTSIAGRVVRAPCGRPYRLADVRLVKEYADGSVIRLRWKTGGNGDYRFEGLQAGARLTLQMNSGAIEIPLPSLAPGQRYAVPEIALPDSC